MTTLAVLQPGYLPWLGFFDQMMRSDVFVYYDDIQYDKHGWRNRNRIKTPNGPQWLTVPVLDKGRHGQLLLEAEIDARVPWARKHLAAIRQNYARAPFLDDYWAGLETLLQRPWRFLVDIDIAAVELMCQWMDIRPCIVRSSELGVTGERSERLLMLCQHFNATTYLSGNAAQDYLDTALFEGHGIRVEWQNYHHPVYPQQHGKFIPYLSALDLLFNVGQASRQAIRGKL